MPKRTWVGGLLLALAAGFGAPLAAQQRAGGEVSAAQRPGTDARNLPRRSYVGSPEAGLHVSGAERQKDKCWVICTPTLTFSPALIVAPLFRQAEVVKVNGKGERVGDPFEIEQEENFLIYLSLTVPTEVPRTNLFLDLFWGPFNDTQENPFTEYEAKDLGEEDLQLNTPTIEMGASFALVQNSATNGWFTSAVNVVDSFGPAAEPLDESAYTHKLQLELFSTYGIFNWLPKKTWLTNLTLWTLLEYTATGLPDEGDIVPEPEADTGLLYLDDASPWAFFAGISVPIAPLTP